MRSRIACARPTLLVAVLALAALVAGGCETDRSNGTAKIRNVILPATYDHVGAPYIATLAHTPAARAWVDAYHPAKVMPPIPEESGELAIVSAGDIWYSIKKHWTLEAQRLVRAKRATPARPWAKGH